MRYHYATLAVGRKKEYMDAYEAVPLTETGESLPPMSQLELEMLTWNLKVLSWEIKDGIMYCRLEGLK